MKIIISPAKKMTQDRDFLEPLGIPAFIREADQLHSRLRSYSYDELKALLKCNDKIAAQNYRRYQEMSLLDERKRKWEAVPALLSYEGIQYQYMAPQVFSDAQWKYVQDHLRILSGFYGILKPCDGVFPYRLEMQSALNMNGRANLYSFWGQKIYQELVGEDRMILNLASKEYSRAVEPFLEPDVRFFTCIFGEETEDKRGRRIKVKGTQAKMARGEMVRWISQNEIQDPWDLKYFSGLEYVYSEADSEGETLVFCKKKKDGK